MNTFQHIFDAAWPSYRPQLPVKLKLLAPPKKRQLIFQVKWYKSRMSFSDHNYVKQRYLFYSLHHTGVKRWDHASSHHHTYQCFRLICHSIILPTFGPTSLKVTTHIYSLSKVFIWKKSINIILKFEKFFWSKRSRIVPLDISKYFLKIWQTTSQDRITGGRWT